MQFLKEMSTDACSGFHLFCPLFVPRRGRGGSLQRGIWTRLPLWTRQVEAHQCSVDQKCFCSTGPSLQLLVASLTIANANIISTSVSTISINARTNHYQCGYHNHQCQYQVSEGGEMPFLTFETRSRFCFLQSRASRRDRDFFTKSQGSRRDRDFCSLNLRLRDEIEIFCHLISKLETRSRIFNEIFTSRVILYSTNTYF